MRRLVYAPVVLPYDWPSNQVAGLGGVANGRPNGGRVLALCACDGAPAIHMLNSIPVSNMLIFRFNIPSLKPQISNVLSLISLRNYFKYNCAWNIAVG